MGKLLRMEARTSFHERRPDNERELFWLVIKESFSSEREECRNNQAQVRYNEDFNPKSALPLWVKPKDQLQTGQACLMGADQVLRSDFGYCTWEATALANVSPHHHWFRLLSLPWALSLYQVLPQSLMTSYRLLWIKWEMSPGKNFDLPDPEAQGNNGISHTRGQSGFRNPQIHGITFSSVYFFHVMVIFQGIFKVCGDIIKWTIWKG